MTSFKASNYLYQYKKEVKYRRQNNILNWPANIDRSVWLNFYFCNASNKENNYFCYNLGQKNLKYFRFLGMRSAIPSLLEVLLEGAVWESLRRGRQGKLTECPYYFIPVDFFWVKCVRYSSCHDGEFWNSKCPSDFEDFWQFSEEFWTLPKMSEDVPANFQSFQSYLKVTILACFDLVMVQSHYSLPSFTAGILFFPGL